MAIKELGHIVLYVRDLERSRAFYRDVLGCRPMRRDFPVAGLTTSYCSSPSVPTLSPFPKGGVSASTTSG